MEKIQISVQPLSRAADIEIKDLKIWVHNWQFPLGVEGDNEDWLHVTVLYEAENAVVWREGNFIESHRLAWFKNSINSHIQSFKDHGFGEESVHLQCDEPYFGFSVEYIHQPPTEDDEYGIGESLQMVVDLTPDHNRQSHRFSEKISFEDLDTLIFQLEKVLKKFPPRIDL